MATVTGTIYWYASAILKALNKEIDFDSDTIKVMLTTSAYAEDLEAHDYKNDVTNEVSGAGYTAGGATLSGKTITYIPDQSATAWAANTAYRIGSIRRPTTANGHIYRCVVAGTSGSTEPSWPTARGATVTDGTVTWAEAGQGYISLDAADTVWTNSTLVVRKAVIYDDTPPGDAAKPLLGILVLDSDATTSDGDLTLQWPVEGVLCIPYNM